MENNMFFSDADLSDIFKELEDANSKIEQVEEDPEMEASQRRFEEIIKKHRGEGKGNQ
jgi:hypothetical protein